MITRAIRSRWMRIPVGLLFGAVLGLGGLKAYDHFNADCCAPGAECCYPGAPCCANHTHAQR
jgi:hypothetical protein